MFTKPVIPFGSAASTQVFFGSERATPQAFSASGRRCRLEPQPQQGWVPNPGLSGHSRCQRPYAARNPRVAASPRCHTGPGPTADFLNPGERGTLGGWVTSHPTPLGLPRAARASRAGSLPPEECGERLLAVGGGRILLLRMAQSPPPETHDKDANPPRSLLLWSRPGA